MTNIKPIDVNKLTVISKILDFYFNSNNANGIPITKLQSYFNQSLYNILTELIIESKVDFYSNTPNPYIMHFDISQQKEKQCNSLKENYNNNPFLKNNILNFGCIYPSIELISANIINYKIPKRRRLLYQNRHHHDFLVFDSNCLIEFETDPRYIIIHKDSVSGGVISSKNQSKKTFIENYYTAIDYQELKENNILIRYVAILIGDFVELDLQTMTYLKPFRISKKGYSFFNQDKIGLHKYNLMNILGDWRSLTIFEAFIMEIDQINFLTNKAFGIDLFKNTFYNRENHEIKLDNFEFIKISTREKYELFEHNLDKLISDNFNDKFFDQQMKSSETFRKDTDQFGNNYQTKNGTLKLLKDWLTLNYKIPKDSKEKPIDDIYKCFSSLRSKRSKNSGHGINKNEYDIKYLNNQRLLIIEVYKHLRLLRLIISNHPMCKNAEIDSSLYKGEICDY